MADELAKVLEALRLIGPTAFSSGEAHTRFMELTKEENPAPPAEQASQIPAPASVNPDEQTFSVDTLPSDPNTWPTYRKTSLTHALKIDGPFAVQTSEGPLHTDDGYLAVDARGYPYPIATDEFTLIYEPADV